MGFLRDQSPVSRHFSLLRQGIDQNRKAEIDYYSLTRDTTSHRVIHPYFLTKKLGYWYLTGYCEMRKGLRTFKFERILSVELYREKFSPPEEVETNKYKHNFLKSMGSRRIEIYFDSKVAPWIKERWGSSVTNPLSLVISVFCARGLIKTGKRKSTITP